MDQNLNNLLQRLSSPTLLQFIRESVSLCKPKDIHICDGSPQEYKKVCQLMEKQGMAQALNPSRPNSFLCSSDPRDVARVESRTFICSPTQEEAGPTNNWREPESMRAELKELFKGSMEGRTLYILPFIMGPPGSPLAQIGIQITDSPYVIASMHLMTRVSRHALELADQKGFIPCMHSVGQPLKEGEISQPWPCHPERLCIAHFPQDPSIWSYGSGYGGNALLGKKCLALRIASSMGKKQSWLAEHMLIVGITNPEGKKHYIAAAFPSACGKSNLAMMKSAFPGWKISCVGDDIAWMYWDEQGQLRAINPEAGFFAVAPGTSVSKNPHAMESITRDTLFTNVALTDDKDVWWEGMSPQPDSLKSWRGNKHDKHANTRAAHPNARFTVRCSQCPSIDPLWEDPKGLPISAILFGGRRSQLQTLVLEAYNWTEGVLMGASLCSERTAAAEGLQGELRHDPFAMLPFCGYNMGDYFQHWLDMGKKDQNKTKIFSINWFQKDSQGKIIWPGFQDNLRILQWIFARCENTVSAIESPLGLLPHLSDLNLQGLDLPSEKLKALFKIDASAWLEECQNLRKYFASFGKNFPSALEEKLSQREQRLQEPLDTGI